MLKAKDCWDGLHDIRSQRMRQGRFIFGDQWGDKIQDPDHRTRTITEKDLLIKKGIQPLKANLLRKIVNNIVGQFRNANTEPIAVVRNSEKDENTGISNIEIGEMLTIALQAAYQENEVCELDAAQVRESIISGIFAQRIEFGRIPNKDITDGKVFTINPSRMFWNPGIEDARSWDLNFCGELYDCTFSEVLQMFAETRADAETIKRYYAHCSNSEIRSYYNNMSPVRMENLDFMTTYDHSLCRVIAVWQKERKSMLLCHDILEGSEFWLDTNKENQIKIENKKRIAEFTANGVWEEDVPLIEYKQEIRLYWYYRFMTPYGDVLREGETPYDHSGSPYTLRFYSMFDGEPHSLVEDLIDRQKVVNRNLAMNDTVINTSAKNPLFVNSGVLKGNTIEQVAANYHKPGAVIEMSLRPGEKIEDHIGTLQGTGLVNGTMEIINWSANSLEEISGVHGALQGKTPQSGTPAALYAQETQNASINILDFLKWFDACRTERDTKLLQLLQQYYTPERFVEIAGKQYMEESRFYQNADRIKNVNAIINISHGASSPAYKMQMEAWLMQLLQMGTITPRVFFNTSTTPFIERVKKEVQLEQEEMMNAQMGQGLAGIAPPAGSMQQTQGGQLPESLIQQLQTGQA